ncbi:MAG: hypothetical protein QOD94_1261 [Alphaproteobacteria bacterium]|jgi:hypothetical protein|nr:hypothetical protein [Alphaproteobacteria bacterium]
MKSIVAIEVHLPRRQVSMLFADPGNMTKWMHDLAHYEHIGGEPGAVGARYRMVPKPRTRQLAFVSTVTDMYLPERLSLRLQSRKVDVLANTTFTALAKDRTKLVSQEKYIFPGFFRWLLGLFTRNRTRRRHRDRIEAFKRFAEAPRL